MEETYFGVEEEQRNFKRNFAANFFDYVFYDLGMSFAAPNTVLVAFVSEIIKSNLAISLLSFLWAVGWFLPPLFSAHYVEKLEWRKNFVLLISSWEVIPWLFLSISSLFSSSMPVFMTLMLIFLFYGLSNFAGGISYPAWLDVLGKVIPQNKRGFFLGLSTFCGGLLSIIGGIVLGFLLETYPFPKNYSICFFIAFIFFAISLTSFSFTKEPPSLKVRQDGMFKTYLSDLFSILKIDRNFRFFIISNMFLCFQNVTITFLMAFAVQTFELSGTSIGIFTSLYLGSNTITNLLWGFIGDRWGHLHVARLGVVGIMITSLLAAYTRSPFILYLLFVMAGTGSAAIIFSNMNLLFELSKEERRPSYVALFTVFQVPFTVLSALMGGIIADFFNYHTLFLLTSLILLPGLLFLLLIKKTTTDN